MTRTLQITALIALAIALLAGMTFIVQWHSRQSGSFPEFSSYRTLPEGTSVLYTALAAERNTQALSAVTYRTAGILILGIRPITIGGDAQWFSDMEDLAAKGNRVIIGLNPQMNRFTDPKTLREALKPWSLELDFTHQTSAPETNAPEDSEATLIQGWPMYFSAAAKWTVLRAENGHPVAIERPQGKGTLVLIANPYLLSNAALVDDRQTTFLTTLLGASRQIVFDETHFGLEESGSLAAIARRFRLQGLILGLALTAALFVWKNASGFPPPPVPSTAAAVAGEASTGAFVNLLRRNIRPEDVLRTCVNEWRKMYARKAPLASSPDIDLAADHPRQPALAYAEIQRILGAQKYRP